jgi:hypothetical protein
VTHLAGTVFNCKGNVVCPIKFFPSRDLHFYPYICFLFFLFFLLWQIEYRFFFFEKRVRLLLRRYFHPFYMDRNGSDPSYYIIGK